MIAYNLLSGRIAFHATQELARSFMLTEPLAYQHHGRGHWQAPASLTKKLRLTSESSEQFREPAKSWGDFKKSIMLEYIQLYWMLNKNPYSGSF